MELNATQLIDDYLDGEQDEAGAKRLRAWLEADPKNVRLFVRHVYLHRQLRDGLLADNVSRCLEASVESSDRSLSIRRSGDQIVKASKSWSWGSLAMLLLLGASLGSGVTWQIATRRADKGTVVFVPGGPDTAAPSSRLVPHVATLVSVTNCRWEQSLSTADLTPGGVIRSGDSLHLLEGVAEVNSTLKNGGTASLKLEGPVAISLSSQGMPNLLYGHLTGSFACGYERFTLDTPLGRVNVSGDASIGVIAAANKVELHVFAGSAALELWAMGVGGAAKQMTAVAGTSFIAHVEGDGSISVENGQSKESGFLTAATLRASQLHISDEYVATVVAAKPIAYWRFEGDVNGAMRNEISDRLHCRMVGDAVRWRPGHDGSTVEFGMTSGPGYLISDDSLDLPAESYTVELWAKPAYFHHGTLFSLLQWSAPKSPIGTHRMALEVCGPVSWFTRPYRTTDPYPGRIRFIHECRTRFDVDCYSPKPYSVRQWQHLVAVKAPSEVRLFLNGQHVDSKEATGPLPGGLRVLMGQLLPVSPQIEDEVTPRLFSGELDEVAVYDRVLDEDEIKQHFELVHPEHEVNGEKGPEELY